MLLPILIAFCVALAVVCEHLLAELRRARRDLIDARIARDREARAAELLGATLRKVADHEARLKARLTEEASA